MPPIKTIRIGPHVFHLRKLDAVPTTDGKTQYGQFCPYEQIIQLKPDCPTSQLAAEIAIHEVFHGVFWTMGIDVSDKMEEHIVGSLAVGWAMVIKDNPKLMQWLMESLE